MSIIYTYPEKTTPAADDLLILSDSASTDPKNKTKTVKISNLPGATGSGITSLNGQTLATQSFANDSNVTITSAGGTHTLGWTGQLPVSRGGTGLSSIASGSILATTAADTLTVVPMAAKGDVLIGDGTTAPSVQGIGTDGTFLKADSTQLRGVLWDKPAWTIATSPATTTQSIVNGNTLTVTGGTGITATVAATDSLTIAANYPTTTAYNTTLGLKDPGGNAATITTNLANYFKIGPYVFIEFYMGGIIKHGSATGDVIMTGLPHAVSATGLVVPGGSCTITANGLFGNSTQPWALVGKVGETGNTEMSIKGHGATSSVIDNQIVNVEWADVDPGEAGSAILGGTIQYLAES